MFFKALLAFLALPCVVAGWAVACGSPLLFAYLALPAVVFHLHIVLHEEPWPRSDIHSSGRNIRRESRAGCQCARAADATTCYLKISWKKFRISNQERRSAFSL